MNRDEIIMDEEDVENHFKKILEDIKKVLGIDIPDEQLPTYIEALVRTFKMSIKRL